jgi:hypothetical protein
MTEEITPEQQEAFDERASENANPRAAAATEAAADHPSGLGAETKFSSTTAATKRSGRVRKSEPD